MDLGNFTWSWPLWLRLTTIRPSLFPFRHMLACIYMSQNLIYDAFKETVMILHVYCTYCTYQRQILQWQESTSWILILYLFYSNALMLKKKTTTAAAVLFFSHNNACETLTYLRKCLKTLVVWESIEMINCWQLVIIFTAVVPCCDIKKNTYQICRDTSAR